MVDIVLIIALLALTAVSFLYIVACDRLRSADAQTGATERPSAAGDGG